MGGPPNPGTKADRRLGRNNPNAGKPKPVAPAQPVAKPMPKKGGK